LPEDVQHRAAQLRVAVQVAVQQLGLERIGQLLRPLEVGDAHEGVVGGGVVDGLALKAPGQPAVAVAVHLQPKWAVGGHAHVDQPQLAVHPVEVVVQALGGVGSQEGASAGLVVPGLVGRAGFHCRDHVHQPGRITARGQHLGDHVFLANVGLGYVFDPRTVLGGKRLRVVADAFTQRQRKLRVVEDSDAVRVQKARHAIGEACARQRTGDDDAVVTRQHPCQVLRVPRCQHVHRHLHLDALG
jgi:hypothetical protein